MALDELPCASSGDAHLLVVVAGRATRRKSVAEPEPVLLGDCVGKIGEAGGALVGRNHQIRVVAVVSDEVRRRYDTMWSRPFRNDVVGKVEQTADQRLVTFDRFGPQLVA